MLSTKQKGPALLPGLSYLNQLGTVGLEVHATHAAVLRHTAAAGVMAIVRAEATRAAPKPAARREFLRDRWAYPTEAAFCMMFLPLMDKQLAESSGVDM